MFRELLGLGRFGYYFKLESAKIPFTFPMAKTKTMVLVFGFSFPFSAGFYRKSGFLVPGKVVLVFGFSFCPREGGWGIFASFVYFLFPEAHGDDILTFAPQDMQ